VLAVGAAELGAGVRVGVLVPADVAEMPPAQRRRVLPTPALVGLHARPAPENGSQAAAAMMMDWMECGSRGEGTAMKMAAATPFWTGDNNGGGLGFGPGAACVDGGLWL
jgi:hypothetical protein